MPMSSRKPSTFCVFVAVSTLGACQTSSAPSETKPEPAAAAPTVSAAAPRSGPSKVELEQVAMGTRVQIVCYTNEKSDERSTKAGIQKAFDEMTRLERILSEWKSDSEVSAINQGAGSPVRVGPDTYDVVSKGIWAGGVSSGTFDITFQTLSDLWKFGDAAEKVPRVPGRNQVNERLKHVGYKKLVLDEKQHTILVPKQTQIGLGGIAKGYIVDRAARVLKSSGIDDFFVQAGGDLYGAGKKPDGSPWISGVQDPRGAHGSYFAVIELSDHAFSTAGDYARFYMAGGKRYHHIIDPRTGYPATESRSVTVWAPDALTADAVDDAVFILGPEKGLALIESLAGTGAVIVDKANKVWVSERLKPKLKILKPPSDGP
jgi:thiamine biosynthesis lipoprotein